MNKDVMDLLFVDGADELCDAVHKGLASDEKNVRVRLSVRGKVLPAAKANLKPKILVLCSVRLARRGQRVQVYAQARQQTLRERGLPWT